MNNQSTNARSARLDRANKAPLSKLNGTKPQAQTVRVHASDESSTGERIYARFNEARDDMLKFLGAPGWKRTLVAAVSAFLVGYGIGYAATTILEWMMVGATIAGTSTFIAMCVYVLGIVAAALLAWKVSSRVCGAILTGEADERAIAAYDATRNALAKLNPMRLFGASSAATVH